MTIEQHLAPVHLSRHPDAADIGYICSEADSFGDIAVTYCDNRLEKARRIVAALNARAGISTERLEQIAAMGSYKLDKVECEQAAEIDAAKFDNLPF